MSKKNKTKKKQQHFIEKIKQILILFFLSFFLYSTLNIYPLLILILTKEDAILGCFLSTELSPPIAALNNNNNINNINNHNTNSKNNNSSSNLTGDGNSYSGTGESFVFSVKPSEKVYHWHPNQMNLFARAAKKGLHIGGG